MATARHFKDFIVRFVIIGLLLSLIMGCTSKVHIAPTTPYMNVKTKIPFHVALVASSDLNKHECSYFALTHNVVFDCGPALYESIIQTMEELFVNVEPVSEINEASAPWDRALWFEVEEFKMHSPGVTKTAHVSIRVKYKVTDNKNSETFSSEITVERYVNIQNRSPLLAFNDYNYSSNSDVIDDMQLAQIYVPIEIGHPESWGKRIIEGAIDELMDKIVGEIVDAYEKQQL